MQFKINIVQKERRIPYVRFMLNAFMLLVLGSFFCQAVFTAYNSTPDAISGSMHQAKSIERQGTGAGWQVQAPLPPKTNICLLDVELTSENQEDKRSTVVNLSPSFFYLQSDNEATYSNYLKHRFLHLNAKVNNRPSLAFFILYHSWKSDLS